MEFQDLKNAIKYPLSDVKMILLLGAVLFLGELVNEVHGNDEYSTILKAILTLVALIMSVLEAGYLFKVIEETTQGSESLPKFSNLRDMFLHGTKEIIVTFIFILFPMIEIVISAYFFSLSKITHNLGELNWGYAFLVLGLISIMIIGFILQGVILNMVHNRGSVRSAFHFGSIREKMGNVGYKNLLLTYIIAFVTFGSLILFFSDAIKNIPFVGVLILMFFIEPYLLLFNIRILGLVDR